MKKKVSIAICVAMGWVAVSLHAIETCHTINFSNSALWGQTPRWGLTDEGIYSVQDASYWYAPEFNLSMITNYARGVEQYQRYDRFNQDTNPRPDYMAIKSQNNGLLKFRTEGSLVRSFRPIDDDGTSYSTVIPTTNDMFIDMLIQLHEHTEAVTTLTNANVNGSAKFVCWISAPQDAGVTNFIITAGCLDAVGNLYRTNYVTTAEVIPDHWYRLTARAIANAATTEDDSLPAFALYLDGELVTCDAANYHIGDDQTTMDRMLAGNDLYASRALFPSLTRTVGAAPSVRGLGLQGVGQLDELGVVTNGNPIARAATSVPVVIMAEWDKVTNAVCTVTKSGEASPYMVTNACEEFEFPVGPGDHVEVTIYTKSVYTPADALFLAGNLSAVATSAGYEFVMKSGASFDSSERLVVRIDTGSANFRVGEEVFELFEDALKAAQSTTAKTVVLENAVTLDPDTENGQIRLRSTYELTLDLHGKKVKGENFLDEAVIYNQGRLAIIDSIGGGTIEAPGTVIETIAANDALEVNHRAARLSMGTLEVTNDFKVIGRVRVTQGQLSLICGDYLTPPDESTESFYLADYLLPERSTATRHAESGGVFWRVHYDGTLAVKFTVPHGTVSPDHVNVTKDSKISEPAVTAPGYEIEEWRDLATGEAFDFSKDTISNETTIAATMSLVTYEIKNDVFDSDFPTEYTVETPLTALPKPSKDYFTFAGWLDANSGNFVAEIGEGATFVGTETPVMGDLDLKATWSANTLAWSNVASTGLAESNGTYSGTFPFTIPTSSTVPGSGKVELAAGTEVVIDSIAFCIVNPTMYPKTANFLVISNLTASTRSVSARRSYKVASDKEYLVGDDKRLANYRPSVVYTFSNLTVKVGEENLLYFATSKSANKTSSFLRLIRSLTTGTKVIGNCADDSASSPIPRYSEYCPAYYITGHLKESD